MWDSFDRDPRSAECRPGSAIDMARATRLASLTSKKDAYASHLGSQRLRRPLRLQPPAAQEKDPPTQFRDCFGFGFGIQPTIVGFGFGFGSLNERVPAGKTDERSPRGHRQFPNWPGQPVRAGVPLRSLRLLAVT